MDLPRDIDERLSAWAWPGGYPIFYLDSQNSVLCVTCARKSDEDAEEIPEFKPIVADVNYEDPALYCEDCSGRIESAYAED
jgi:hypothetical protein